jgi:hypothetical protein
MTLGNSAAARIRLIVWYLPFGEPHDFAGYKACGHDIAPVPAEMARRYGPDAPTRVAQAARLFSLRTPRYGYGRDRRRRREEARAGAPEGCSVGLADCFGQDGLTRRNPGRGRPGVSRRDYRHCASSTFGTVRMKRTIGIRASDVPCCLVRFRLNHGAESHEVAPWFRDDVGRRYERGHSDWPQFSARRTELGRDVGSEA